MYSDLTHQAFDMPSLLPEAAEPWRTMAEFGLGNFRGISEIIYRFGSANFFLPSSRVH